jgi:hypothetical protein
LEPAVTGRGSIRIKYHFMVQMGADERLIRSRGIPENNPGPVW